MDTIRASRMSSIVAHKAIITWNDSIDQASRSPSSPSHFVINMTPCWIGDSTSYRLHSQGPNAADNYCYFWSTMLTLGVTIVEIDGELEATEKPLSGHVRPWTLPSIYDSTGAIKGKFVPFVKCESQSSTPINLLPHFPPSIPSNFFRFHSHCFHWSITSPFLVGHWLPSSRMIRSKEM